MAIRAILCPIDLSAAGEEALRFAVSLAARLEIEAVHVLHVHQAARVPSGKAAEAARALKQHAARELEDVAKRYCAHDVEVVPHLVEGVPYEAIPAEAARLGVDLVVIGTHGRTGLQHALLGSVAERVVQRSPVAVCTVPVARKR